jgi:hypothetical protein
VANIAVSILMSNDNNPIALLLTCKGKTAPPAGFQLLTDEEQRLLRDERGAYLIANKED